MAIQLIIDILVQNPIYFTPIVLYVVFYLTAPRSSTIYDNYEHLGNPWWLPNLLGKGPHTFFSEGYNKIIVPFDKPFVVTWWSLKNLILPAKYLPDLQRVKTENASFLKNFSDAVNLQHSVGNLYESDRMGDIVRKGMNPALSSLTTLIMEEIKKALDTEVGKPEDLFIMISHRVVSRLLAGEELARDENFIHLSHKFGDSVFVTGLMTAELPLGPFRRIVGWVLAQYHRVLLYRIMKMTEPVVARRMEEARNEKNALRYNDSIDWAIKLNADNKRDSRIVSLEMLHILEAAGGAPGAMMSEMMYQMLVEPHYFQTLECEINEAMAANADMKSMLDSLPLMDSFIMETNRMYPVGGVTAARTVMREPWVLHDGTTLPFGTRIGFPCKAIQMDPALFHDPMKFDGFRFARLNEAAEKSHNDEAKRYSAATATPTNLSWGFGKHVCPGRFYAVRLAKMMFTSLLREYEFQWDGKPRDKHPASFEVQGQFLPNIKAKICIRKRRN